MLTLSFKIWLRGLIVFAILCVVAAIPTFGVGLLGLAVGVPISLVAIPIYLVAIFILKRSEASATYSCVALFLCTPVAVILARYIASSMYQNSPLEFSITNFYLDPFFWAAWLCSVVGFVFSLKPINQFFKEDFETYQTIGDDLL